MALTSGCKASGSQERNAERRKLGSSCHTLASSFPLPTFFEANSLKINSVRFCRLDQDLTMMRGLERRLVENLCNSGATMPSRMNLPNHLNLSVPISCSVSGSGHACDRELAKVVTLTSNHLWAKSASVGGHDPARGGAVARCWFF